MSRDPKPREVRASPRKRAPAKAKTANQPGPSSKLDQMISALRTGKGASISDLMEITGWQAHSVRGAIAGALKAKRGLAITSDKKGAERIYRITGKA